MIEKFFTYFVEVLNSFDNKILSITDKYIPVSEEYKLSTKLISKIRALFVTSSLSIEDDLILVFEHKEEE